MRMKNISIIASVVALLVVTALPAVAGWENGPADPPGPVERYQDVLFGAHFDAEDGLIALGGPPIEQGCFGQGFDDLVEVQDIVLSDGVVVRVVRDGDYPMQVYAAATYDELCERVFAGETVEPVASGFVRYIGTDNDFNVSLTRQNVFGNTATGTLTTPDGETCRFTAQFRASISQEGDFRIIKEDVTLRC